MSYRSALSSLVVILALGGCSSSTGPEAEVAAAAPAEPPRPKDAPQIAQSIVGGKLSALVHVDRVRTHPSAPKLLQLGPIRDLLEGTSIDPLKDVERVFVTGPSASEPRAVVFAEHNLSPDRIPVVVQDMVDKSEPKGEVITAGPEWRVRIQKKGHGGVVAFLPPSYVIVVPEDLESSIDAFEATGGLPGPVAEEVAKFHVVDPSNTLRARGAPTIPASISTLTGDVFGRADGGLTLAAVGQSTAESADEDARRLTKSIDDATSVGGGFFRIRLFQPVVFRSNGDRVVTRHELSQGELETLMSLAAAFVK